jgi:hypothetical protein
MENKEHTGPVRRPKTEPPLPKTKSAADAIVRAAYKKVARDRNTREAMKLCLEESPTDDERREQP